MVHPTFWLAFTAGLLSFLSPCTLPLYPTYLSYISGMTYGKESLDWQKRREIFLHTFFFVFGFSIVFLALGLSASTLGHLIVVHRRALRITGGLLLVLMGLVLTEVFTPGWLMRERRWTFHRSQVNYLTSIFVGISFAAGWTPCIGPILASILILAASESELGLPMMCCYILGFAIPFFILALTLSSVRPLVKYGARLSRVAGFFMLIFGLLLATNTLGKVTAWLIQVYGGFTGY